MFITLNKTKFSLEQGFQPFISINLNQQKKSSIKKTFAVHRTKNVLIKELKSFIRIFTIE